MWIGWQKRRSLCPPRSTQFGRRVVSSWDRRYTQGDKNLICGPRKIPNTYPSILWPTIRSGPSSAAAAAARRRQKKVKWARNEIIFCGGCFFNSTVIVYHNDATNLITSPVLLAGPDKRFRDFTIFLVGPHLIQVKEILWIVPGNNSAAALRRFVAITADILDWLINVSICTFLSCCES